MPFTKTFHGFIENIIDTLLIIEACRNGLLPTINRRLVERERSAIKSGTIIVFDESESGIKRWTDGFLWSPSRILGNFLVYRELANRENRTMEDDYNNNQQQYTSNEESSPNTIALLHQRERSLVGSLTTANTSYNFKKDGLVKKTIRIMVNGNYLHIVSYYNKNDVLNNLLPTPSASPQLACLQISADLMPHLQGFTQHNHHVVHRKRSRSAYSDDDSSRYIRRGGYPPPPPSYPYPVYNSNNSNNIDYPSYYTSNSNNNNTPFTELPPPLPSNNSNNNSSYLDYQAVTTAKAPGYASINNNKKVFPHYNSNSSNNSNTSVVEDPSSLLSPSPSPTPSPPSVTTCDNTRTSNNHFYPIVDYDQQSFIATSRHHKYHHHRPALDNH